ncbi:hypothetical protein OTU49_013256 [Cherax quadricarinatus]|uniref:Uncharacterized protein n=1 Tax=Cherax quadricarinatus TaxID=27406 RepID=A0AAW0VUH9_CHEQU
MKLIVLVAMLGLSLAAPQHLLGLRRSLGENNRGNTAPATVPPEDDPKPRQESDDTPLLFFDRPFFPEVFRRPLFPRVSFPRLPSFDSFPDIPNLPANYDNVTHEVKIVNGSRVEMNRTMTKTTNDNGNVFFTQVQTFRRLPEASPDDDSEVSAAGGESLDSPAETDTQAPKSGRVPEGNTVDNQVELYEDFGRSSEIPLSRNRRWFLEWFNNVGRRTPTPATTNSHFYHNHHPNALSQPTDKVTYNTGDKPFPEAESAAHGHRRPTTRSHKPSSVRIPIINDADIAVNYGPATRTVDPDAEVIDYNLIREDERRYSGNRAQPVRSQPMISQPVRSKPMLSQPIRSQPMLSQPIRSQPMMSQPIRSQPMMSQPIRSKPMLSQPIRSQSLRL